LETQSVLSDLNPAQKEAVTTVEGPLLVFAGAGSGKTRVITHRIAYLLYEIGIPPDNILAVTFTNKAAREMQTRLLRLAPPDREASDRSVFFATYHRFCAWLLRAYGQVVGVQKHFTIFDDADSVHLIRQILKSFNLDSGLYRPAAIAAMIDRAKNDLRSPADLQSQADGPVQKAAAKVFPEYDRRLREMNALDFSDLLVFAVKLLDTSPALLRQMQEKFAYILVDEYQDTNIAQYSLLRKLAAHGNLCVVGDDDQAIYSWRGADIRNILSFEKDFPNARVVKLEENYRSTQGILDIAYQVIRHNRDRADKRLQATRHSGQAPMVYTAADGYDEAAFVARQVRELSSEWAYSDMAVFYRMTAQSRLIEEEFLARAIPYVVVSGVGFYERREVKDLLAYLRVIANPADDAAFTRILNVPKRGIGESTAALLRESARSAGCSQLDILARFDSIDVSPAVKKRLHELHDLLTDLRNSSASLSVEEILRRIVSVTDFFAYLEKTDPAGFDERAANVQELYTVAQEFARRSGGSDQTASVTGFVEELSLLTDADRLDPDADRVSLMTLHAAKGLEFSAVFLIGLEEGSLPHASAFESQSELEEERRLCYVGITRAKDRLFLSHACSRRIYGESRDDIRASRFLEEAGLPEGEPARRVSSDPTGSIRSGGSDRIERMALDEETAAYGVSPGDRIRHPVFGAGVLLRISGRAENATAMVRFDRVGKKRLRLANARLSRLDE